MNYIITDELVNKIEEFGIRIEDLQEFFNDFGRDVGIKKEYLIELSDDELNLLKEAYDRHEYLYDNE